MIGEKIPSLKIEICQEIPMIDGGSIVLADPIENNWQSANLENNNVFRLDKYRNLIWQISRNENGHINWEVRNKNPTIFNPTFKNGYRDPFASMGKKFFVRRPTGDSRPYYPKFTYELFDTYAPGRLLGLSTYQFEYDLNPDTGVANCTGVPVK